MADVLRIDPYTQDQAIDYANTEADIVGFKRGSDRWKSKVKEYLSFAVSTMAVGRNPRSFRYKVIATLYPDVFGSQGFAGKVSRNYIRGDNEKGLPLQDVQSRILSAVMNLTKLFENGVMQTKNVAVGQPGKLKEGQESELQFPNKEDFDSKEEFEAAARDVIYHWIARDVITNALIESLQPFFNLTKDDVDTILAAINVEGAGMKEIASGAREEFIKRLRATVQPKMASISYRKTVLG